MGRFKGIIFSFLAIGIEIISTFLFTPLLLKKLGQSEYGVYSLVLSITSYLALFDFGVGQSVVRFMSKFIIEKNINSQKKFLGIVTIHYFICMLLIICIGIVLTFRFPYIFSKGLSLEEIALGQKLIFVSMLTVSISIGTAGYYYTLIAYENFTITKGILILVNFLRVFLTVVCLLNGMRSLSVVCIMFITTFLFRIYILFYVLYKLKIRPILKGIKVAEFKEIIGFSTFIFFQMAATQINNMADQILLGSFVESVSLILAIYAIGALINQYMQTLGSSINGILMPGIMKFVERKPTSNEMCIELVKIGRLIFMFIGLVWCVFLVFGEQFIVLWAGKENKDAFIVALVLMFPQVIILTQGICSQVLWAKNKHKKIACLKLVIVCINIFFTIVLIKWNALFGAIIGTFISLIVGDVLVKQFILQKELNLDMFKYFKELFSGIGKSLFCAVLFGKLFSYIQLSGWKGFFINCGVMVIIYLMCLVNFGLNEDEKILMRKFKHRIKMLYRNLIKNGGNK